MHVLLDEQAVNTVAELLKVTFQVLDLADMLL